MSQPQQSDLAKEQSSFLGRMLAIPIVTLPLFAVWVVVATVLTPIPAEVAERAFDLRVGMIWFGGLLIAIIAIATAWRLAHWDA